MADYKIVSPVALGLGGGGRVNQVDSVRKYPLGLEVDAVDPSLGAGRFVYCQGSNVASQGQWVHIQNQSAVLLASANTASNFPIGVACGVLSATGLYGWVQVQGRVDYVKGTNTGLTAGVPHYIGATVGQLVSNAAAGGRVMGAAVPANLASGSSASQVWDLNRPFIAGVTAAL